MIHASWEMGIMLRFVHVADMPQLIFIFFIIRCQRM